eukprot:scaffold2144_cov334-Prasinococcus_capsulatus_cf.AAC.7
MQLRETAQGREGGQRAERSSGATQDVTAGVSCTGATCPPIATPSCHAEEQGRLATAAVACLRDQDGFACTSQGQLDMLSVRTRQDASIQHHLAIVNALCPRVQA